MKHIFLIAALMCAVATNGYSQNTAAAALTTPGPDYLGVRNNGSTTLYFGQFVQPDTNRSKFAADSAVGIVGTYGGTHAFPFPDTLTITKDTANVGNGFILATLNHGSMLANADTIWVTGTLATQPWNSLTRGKDTTAAYAMSCGGDSTQFHDGIWIDIDTIKTHSSTLDSITLSGMPILGVVKADSLDVNTLGMVGTARKDSIQAHRWGRIQTLRKLTVTKAVVNGDNTNVYPWTPLTVGTSGLVASAKTTEAASDTTFLTKHNVGYSLDMVKSHNDTSTVILTWPTSW